MADVTQLSMRDARDAEDKRLLANGEIDLLLGGWYETIVDCCIGEDARPGRARTSRRPSASGCGASSRPASTATGGFRSASSSTR